MTIRDGHVSYYKATETRIDIRMDASISLSKAREIYFLPFNDRLARQTFVIRGGTSPTGHRYFTHSKHAPGPSASLIVF